MIIFETGRLNNLPVFLYAVIHIVDFMVKAVYGYAIMD
jgi:hypothetical protein